ncbi:MAG: SecDF P1 head subdomain-containing protein [Bacteroidia bacterium]
MLVLLLVWTSCTHSPTLSKPVKLRDGCYEVVKPGNYPAHSDSLKNGQVVIEFDTLFNPDDYTTVVIDTSDHVPLELETAPVTEQQQDRKKLLSVSLTPSAAEKMRSFTATRVMKQVVIVLDSKAVTMHRIREAITGNGLQITRCSDNACDYLCVRLKNNVKK